MVLCAAPSYLKQHGFPTTVEQLRRAPRLAFSEAVSPGDWTITSPDGHAHVIDGPVRLAANNMQMLLAAALAGQGVAYGPSFVFGQAIASGALRGLMSEYQTSELTIHAVYPTKRYLSLKLRLFIEHLSDSFGAAPQWDRLVTAGGSKSSIDRKSSPLRSRR
jgi:DNA-binding transcriptional LysR family regulator